MKTKVSAGLNRLEELAGLYALVHIIVNQYVQDYSAIYKEVKHEDRKAKEV